MYKFTFVFSIVIFFTSITFGGSRNVLEAPIKIKRPVSISRKTELGNSIVFSVENKIEIEKDDDELYFKQDGKYVDPRSILYELYKYPYFREAIEELDSNQKKSRAMLHLGIHFSWIFSPAIGAGFFVGRGFRKSAARSNWIDLINDYNELIEKGSIVYVKKGNSKITMKHYDPAKRNNNMTVFSIKFANLWIKNKVKPIQVNIKNEYFSNLPYFSYDYNMTLPTTNVKSLNLEFGGFINNNFIGCKGYAPLPFNYSPDNSRFVSDTGSAIIEYKEIRAYTFGGFIAYERRFQFLKEHLSLGLSLNAGCLITLIRMRPENEGIYINDYFISGSNLADDAGNFRSNNFNIGGPGFTVSGGFKYFKFTLEYMANFGFANNYTFSEYDYDDDDDENKSGFLTTHVFNFGLSIGR